ncbi:HlyD family efflux transporter periplasmic adaptor subunit [Opitutus terrae]|uniref:Secretion protein HlyD family protein n=1 Tax=Opitutus terrae (strain DSM 11246 / JCM 15787 / PB90-1) TaxID=452637 RepID=B1ZWS7_OPITP|nr:HlyD family efflux transporter periplasmic adaptor subunit [Opitutus terrae]ACB74204.1 secretion protein HlyD family protein [Opitutus terrae PB90-1]
MKSTLLPKDRRRSPALVLLAALLVALAGCARGGGSSNDALVLSGNIEVVDAQLGFKVPGRVVARTVDEGARVTAGQLIARLDDAEQTQELALRRAELAAVEAVLAELEAGSRPQEIAAALAGLHSAEAERDRARLDFTRAQELRARDVIADRDFETAQALLKVAEARAAEAGERLALLQAGPRTETIQQARARTEQARAAVALAETRLANTQLLSPLTGQVLSHNIEPGEFVAAGTPVVTVADLAHVWVRAYVNQTDLGHVKLGQKVAVRTDTFPDKTYEGTVGFISSEAEFTPKTVQTPKERVKLVFRIKVDVANPNDELKSGMPADVTIGVAS